MLYINNTDSTEETYRTEDVILGGMLYFSFRQREVFELISYRLFEAEENRLIYSAAAYLNGFGPVDAYTVANELGKHNELSKAGGLANLVRLTEIGSKLFEAADPNENRFDMFQNIVSGHRYYLATKPSEVDRAGVRYGLNKEV